MNDRNIVILKKVIRYSDEINWTIQKFSLDYNKFSTDFIAKNAISMCILQIGELVGKFSEEFKETYNEMPWRDIISMRNRAAHAYGEMDLEIIWRTATEDIIELKSYCKEILEKF